MPPIFVNSVLFGWGVYLIHPPKVFRKEETYEMNTFRCVSFLIKASFLSIKAQRRVLGGRY